MSICTYIYRETGIYKYVKAITKPVRLTEVLCIHRSLMHVLCRALCGLMRSFHRLAGQMASKTMPGRNPNSDNVLCRVLCAT